MIIKNIFTYSLITINLLSTISFANNEGISHDSSVTTTKNKSNKLRIYNPHEIIVDIKAPDNNGVSHNQYPQFHTAKNSIIHLNKDASLNLNMLNQETNPEKITINEVVSNIATRLNSVLNIKGTPAKVIIVNPNGIIFNSCQFTNTTEVDLVAGRIYYIDKTLSYHTNKGKIIFDGKSIQSNYNFLNQKSNFIAKLSVYAGQLQLKK